MVVKKDNGEEPKKRAKSKQIVRKEVVSKTGVLVKENYCRKCMKTLPIKEFMQATDPLDTNGFMSVCKSCINDLYLRIYENEKGVDKTILRLCRMLNVKYSTDAIDAVKAQINTCAEKGQEFSNVFGVYKAKLVATQKTEIGKREIEDMTFHEPIKLMSGESIPEEESDTDIKQLQRFWGTNFSKDDFQYLEEQFSEWSKSHRIDTQTEKTLLKFICLKELEIRRAITEGSSTSSLVKEFQDLIKTSGLAPNSATVSSAGKSQENWGNFVKMIEEQEPCEVFKDRELFKDFDNINKYFLRFILRPMKNFVVGSREFNIGDDDNLAELDEIDSTEESLKYLEEDDPNGNKS
jgi:hypothetical protein